MFKVLYLLISSNIKNASFNTLLFSMLKKEDNNSKNLSKTDNFLFFYMRVQLIKDVFLDLFLNPYRLRL